MKKSQVLQYKTWVEVDAGALQHNFRVVQKHVGNGVSIMAIVKSNAYGHGLNEIAEIFRKSHFRNFGSPTSEISAKIWFGVDSIEEAFMLKKAGIKNPILILGYVPRPLLVEVVRNGFRIVLYDLSVAKELVTISKRLGKKTLAHIKLETGTWRQGIVSSEIATFALFLKKNQQHITAEGIYTHFADSEDMASSFWKTQITAFEKGVSRMEEIGVHPFYRHASSSAAILCHTKAHFNMVRLGISLYGLYPSSGVQRASFSTVRLRPALSWKTRVAQVKQVNIGSTISYDRTFTVLRPMTIAVLPVGYWDGFDRRFSNNGTVLVGGKRVSVVGRVCMNMVMADVTGIHRVCVGDEVVLIGEQGNGSIASEEIAERIGTINYEIISRINPLIPRILK